MRIARHIVYWILVVSGLPWLVRRLNRRKVLILAYHSVHADRADPLLNFDGMHVRARRFARQMRYVSRHYDVVDLDSLLDGPAPGSGRPRAVITFDDGYRNVGRVASPILRRIGLPATLFVPTDFMRHGRGLWWDRLRVMLGATRQSTLRFSADGREHRLPIRTVTERGAALEQLTQALRRLVPRQREAVLAGLATSLDVPTGDGGALGTALTVDEVRALAKGGMRIGSHGVTHDSFLHLEPAVLSWELTESRRRLESIVEGPVEWLAYPYGDFSDEVAEAAKRAGYRGAVTTIESLTDDRCRPHELTRVGVHDGVTFAHFVFATSGLRDLVLSAAVAARRLWHRPRKEPSPNADRAAIRTVAGGGR